MAAQGGTIAAPAAYNTNPDVALGFEPNTWVLKATAGTVVVSFDGKEDHVTLASAEANLPLTTKFTKLWVKQSGGAATLRWSALT